MGFLERTFPGWGLRRERARQELDAIRSAQAGYDARLGPEMETSSPKAANKRDRPTQTKQARKLQRDNDSACGILQLITDHVVGPNAIAQKHPDHEDLTRDLEAWRAAVGWVDVVTQVESELWVTGEVLLVRSRRPVGDGTSALTVEVAVSERLASMDRSAKENSGEGQTGNRIEQGIEFSAAGDVVAYWIHAEHPGDDVDFSSVADLAPVRVEAERVLHLKETRVPGEIRGNSRFGPVAASLDGIARFMNASIDKAEIAAHMAFQYNRQSRLYPGIGQGARVPTNPGATDSLGNPVAQFVPGMYFEGSVGDELKIIGSGVQADGLPDFLSAAYRRVAAGLNVSYALLTRDFGGHNFTTLRASFVADTLHWRCRQARLIRQLERPILAWWLEASALTPGGPALGAEGAIEALVSEWEFVPQGQEWVDRLKEYQATRMGLEDGTEDPYEITRQAGGDPEAIADSRKRLAEYYESIDLDPPAWLKAPAPPPAFGEEPGAEEGDEEADGDVEDDDDDKTEDDDETQQAA